MYLPQSTNLRQKRFGEEEFSLSPTYKKKSRTYLFAKRAFDLTLSLTVTILFLWWLIPILAILIKLDSRGPVFFMQKRVGLYGRTFYCLKLRTMVVNKHADSRQAEKDDPRITMLGNFLRLSCLDELPQFFNVILGQMTIVGPRPHMIKDCEEFTRHVPEYALRELMRPGITGMAQIKGYRGKTTSFFDIFHRFQWDAFYVRNANFLLDIRIIQKTFAQVVGSMLKLLKKTETTEPNFAELKRA
ncbi:MAG: sugar transferase [Gemmatimonadaceae bacterium]|nr:sugar transferase [Chitinophagaceae bacterium]